MLCPHGVHSSLHPCPQSVPTEPRCLASSVPRLLGMLYLGEGGITEPITAPEGMMSPEQALWGDSCRERRSCSGLQGPQKALSGWLHHGQLEADAGPLHTSACPQVTGATCPSAESQGRPVPAHLHGSWLLCLPPRLPGTSLESLPVTGTSPGTIQWLSAIGCGHPRCHRNRCLHHTVLKAVIFLHSFPGSPVPDMPMVMLSHHHAPVNIISGSAWSTGASF